MIEKNTKYLPRKLRAFKHEGKQELTVSFFDGSGDETILPSLFTTNKSSG